jgi:hypothetical protein
VHCALGLSLLRLLAWPSIWASSAWAGSPLPEAGEPRPTAPGGSARSIPVNRRNGEVGKLTKSKLASRGARFWGQKGGVPTDVGLLTTSTVGWRGAIDDRPEERSMAPVDGSAGNTVVGLGCGVTERRGAAVDSAVAVWGCADGAMKKGGELRCVVSEGDTTGCMLGTWRQQRHAAPASEARWHGRDSAVGTAPA